MTAVEIPTPDPRTLDEAVRPFASAIAPHYALKREIGRGGMGVVYLARDKRLGREVAIKTLPPALAKDASLRERFLRETRTAGAMSHPNIVPIHGADEIDGHVFFVMSLVDGDSLAARITAGGPLSARDTALLMRDVASALAHAHERGIVHRDVKAENILVDRGSGRALVTDFGVARLAEATPLTITGQLLGSVHYVSPEQVSGGAVDGRSDLYSLGVVGFLALTGRFPFDAEVASAVLVMHATTAPPPVGSIAAVPAALAAIVDRCLAKNAAHRFASAAELRDVLEDVLVDLDRARKVPARPVRVSDTEAHAVWKRASELQAQTGIQPRPEPVAKARDAEKDATRRKGLKVDELRHAASEAGIDDTYVNFALKEHGLIPGGAKPPVPAARAALPGHHPEERHSRFASVPLRVVRDTAVPGELDQDDLERLVPLLLDDTGQLGRTAAMTRELAWWTGGAGAKLRVSVIPSRGQTHVRITRDLRRRWLVTFGFCFVTLGPISGLMVGAFFAEGLGVEVPGVLLGLATAFTAPFFTARAILQSSRRRVVERIERLTDRIAAKIRQSIG